MKKILSFCAAMLFASSMFAAEPVEIASGTFDGKAATYTEGWSTTGTGLSRNDCVIIGLGENITSPEVDLSEYESISIVLTGRRYGTLTGSKATVLATFGDVELGSIDITSSSVGSVDGSIEYTISSDMTTGTFVFTCSNATSAGSTHGAGIGSITISGVKKSGNTDPDPTPTPSETTITDILNNALTGVSGTNYTDWSNKTSNSEAVYAGRSAGQYSSIQLRTSGGNEGVITTQSGGKLVSITIKANSNTTTNRAVDVYASHDAYTAASELFGDSPKGTKVASLDVSNGQTASYTFTEDYEYIGFRSNNAALYLDEVQIVWALESGEVVVARPTFEPAATDFVDNVEVTLAAEEGAAIYYTLNGDQPTTSSTLYAAPFTLTETTTVKAIAVKEGVESAVAEKTYTKLQVLTCTEFAALANGESGMLGEVVVTYVNGGNTYLKDETGALLLYKFDFGLKAGDVVTGLKGTMSLYSNILPELIPSVALTDLNVTAGEAPAPEEVTAMPTLDNLSQYIILKGATVAAGTFNTESASNLDITFANETLTLRNTYKLAQTFVADKKYDVVGTVNAYNNEPQINFISAEEVVEDPTALDNAESAVKAVKSLENGQLIIRKGAHTYNAQGMLLQ